MGPARSVEKQHDEGSDAVASQDGEEITDIASGSNSVFIPVSVASLGVVAVMAIVMLLCALRMKNKKTENGKEGNKPNVDGGRVASGSISVEMSMDAARSTATISV